MTVRDGEKGPVAIEMVKRRVQTRLERKRTGPGEWLVVTRRPLTADRLVEARAHKRELTALSPCSTPSSCRLVLSVRACTSSLVQPGAHSGFLMPPTPWTTA